MPLTTKPAETFNAAAVKPQPVDERYKMIAENVSVLYGDIAGIKNV